MENKVKEALEALDKVQEKLIMRIKNIDYPYTSSKNKWRIVPSEVAGIGVLSCTIGDGGAFIRELIYIPQQSFVKPHLHENHMEQLFVLHGRIHYEIYDTDEYSLIVDEGILEEGDSFTVNDSTVHFVFTTENEAYILATFTDV